MILGAYGRFWEAELVNWTSPRLIGRRGINRGSIDVTDFRFARGVYVLYDELGIYYAGLAAGQGGLGGRLKDHTRDKHAEKWNRFSWFAFDSPSDERDADGVRLIDEWESLNIDKTGVLIRDLEALLIAAMRPFANSSNTQFAAADEWTQVATRTPPVVEFDSIKDRLA